MNTFAAGKSYEEWGYRNKKGNHIISVIAFDLCQDFNSSGILQIGMGTILCLLARLKRL